MRRISTKTRATRQRWLSDQQSCWVIGRKLFQTLVMRQRLRRNLLSRQGSVNGALQASPSAPLARRSRFFSAPVIVRDTTQPLRRSRGVSLRTTTQWRHPLQRHLYFWLTVCKHDVIHIATPPEEDDIHRVKWRHRVSMVTTRSPFCDYKMPWCVELNGEYLSCYSNKIKSVNLRDYSPRDHWLPTKRI